MYQFGILNETVKIKNVFFKNVLITDSLCLHSSHIAFSFICFVYVLDIFPILPYVRLSLDFFLDDWHILYLFSYGREWTLVFRSAIPSGSKMALSNYRLTLF